MSDQPSKPIPQEYMGRETLSQSGMPLPNMDLIVHLADTSGIE